MCWLYLESNWIHAVRKSQVHRVNRTLPMHDLLLMTKILGVVWLFRQRRILARHMKIQFVLSDE
jgi:hypothetical protein